MEPPGSGCHACPAVVDLVQLSCEASGLGGFSSRRVWGMNQRRALVVSLQGAR